MLKWNFVLSGDGGSHLCVFARKVYGNAQYAYKNLVYICV